MTIQKLGRLIVVDYRRNLDQMLIAGEYDAWSNEININRFRLIGNGIRKFRFEILHFERGTPEKEICAEMRYKGLRHAAIEELLALTKEHFDLSRESAIACLGSIAKIHGLYCVPCIEMTAARKELRLAIPWLYNGSLFCGRYGILAIQQAHPQRKKRVDAEAYTEGRGCTKRCDLAAYL